MKAAGLPHSEISGSKPVDGSPKLIAVFRVLHSLPMPRHPSCARIRLAEFAPSSPLRPSDSASTPVAHEVSFDEDLGNVICEIILAKKDLPTVRSQSKPNGERRRMTVAPYLDIRVVILFNFQLSVVKDQVRLLGEQGESISKDTRARKGVFEKNFSPYKD